MLRLNSFFRSLRADPHTDGKSRPTSGRALLPGEASTKTLKLLSFAKPVGKHGDAPIHLKRKMLLYRK